MIFPKQELNLWGGGRGEGEAGGTGIEVVCVNH